MGKLKIMLSHPVKNKTKDEIDKEQNEMANIIFDYYGGDCEVISPVIENHELKSELECFSESVYHMSQVDVLAMGFSYW